MERLDIVDDKLEVAKIDIQNIVVALNDIMDRLEHLEEKVHDLYQDFIVRSNQ